MIFSRKAARTGVILFPLLGLTWMIGFVALPLSYVWPKYIFVILNSLQVSHRVEWFNDLFTNTNVDVLVIPGGGVGNIMAELLFNLVDVENVISFPFFVSSCGSFSHVFISSCDVFFCFFRECLSFSWTPGAGTRLVLYWNIYSNPTVASKCISSNRDTKQLFSGLQIRYHCKYFTNYYSLL